MWKWGDQLEKPAVTLAGDRGAWDQGREGGGREGGRSGQIGHGLIGCKEEGEGGTKDDGPWVSWLRQLGAGGETAQVCGLWGVSKKNRTE